MVGGEGWFGRFQTEEGGREESTILHVYGPPGFRGSRRRWRNLCPELMLRHWLGTFITSYNEERRRRKTFRFSSAGRVILWISTWSDWHFVDTKAERGVGGRQSEEAFVRPFIKALWVTLCNEFTAQVEVPRALSMKWIDLGSPLKWNRLSDSFNAGGTFWGFQFIRLK